MHQNVSIKLYLKIKAMKRIIIAKARKSNSTLVKLKLEYLEHRMQRNLLDKKCKENEKG